jgi:adenylate cyclase class IV
MIEVEQRGLLTEEQYIELQNRLKKEAVFLGEDNKYVEYLIYSDKLLKLIKNTSKQIAVLSLKLNPIGEGSFYDETETNFPVEKFEDLQKIITNITKPDQIIKGTQKRENFKLGDVEIALKWSEDWKYHFELEYMIDNENDKNLALEKLKNVADLLNLKAMTIEEEKEFTDKIRANRK